MSIGYSAGSELLSDSMNNYLWDLELCLDFLLLRFDGDSFLIDLDLSISSW